MPQLHPRTMQVSGATADLHNQAIDFADRRQLTNTEMVGILLHTAGRFATLALRDERHPDDPLKKADEA